MTQKEKILAYMIRSKGSKEWFYPYDFMRSEAGEFYVGYKAPTRIAELHDAYPKMFDKRDEGKYKLRRFRLESVHEFIDEVEPKLRKFILSELKMAGVGYKKYVTKPEYLPDGKVRLHKVLENG